MHLTRFVVGFPILRLYVRITHSTPRPPTAFERVLLSICDRFGNNKAYNNISIENIFEDFLCVAGPASLLKRTLEELTGLDVIRCKEYADNLDTTTLQDIEITERGQRMLSEDMLPAKPQQHDEIFCYDPVQERLLSELEAKTYVSQAPPTSLVVRDIEKLFPEEKIRLEISSGRYPWWSSTSRIEKLELSSEPSVLWRETPATLVIEQGSMRVVFGNSRQTNYVNSLDSDEIYRLFVDPILMDERLSVAVLSRFPICDLDDVDEISEKLIPFPEVLNDFPKKTRVWLVDGSSYLVSCPEQAESHQTVICFDQWQETDDVVVKWNDTRDGCIVSVKWVYPLQDAMIVSNKHIYRGRRLRLKVGQKHYELPLVLCTAAAAGDAGPLKILSDIATILRNHGNEDDALIPSLWQPEMDFWRDYSEHLNNLQISLPEKLQQLQRARKRVKDISAEMKSDVWDRSVLLTVRAHLNASKDPISIDDIGKLVADISLYKLSSADLKAELETEVMDRVQYPRDLDEYSRIATAFKNGDSTWRIPFPSPYYTPEILKEIANEFQKSELSDRLGTDNNFVKAIQQLLNTYERINAAIGGKGVDGLVREEDYIALLKLPKTGTIADLAEVWASQYNNIGATYKLLESHLDGSLLAFTNKRIEKIGMLMHRLVDNLDHRFRSVYVLDTSALLARPEILKSIKRDEYIVVSKSVIEELDNKKRDEKLRTRVVEVQRAITKIPKQQVKFCDGDMSLLPPDYRLKGDNLILSVAVRYRKHRPVLITNDNNLALKATAEGIRVLSADEWELTHLH